MLVSAAGISHSQLLSGPTITAAQMMTVVTPAILRMRGQALRRPGLRFRTFGGVFHNPMKLRTELLWEFAEGAGTEGFLPAVRGLIGYDFLDRLESVELPALIVWGRNDRIVPPADSAGYGSRLHNSRTVIYDAHGPLPHGGAAGALQPGARGFPGWLGGCAAGVWGFIRAIAGSIPKRRETARTPVPSLLVVGAPTR